jgi:hypothetical protein
MTHRCADIPLCQMVARVAKNIIRAMLREKMKELKVPSSEPYRQLVLTLLNLFSGHSDKAHEFWTSNKAPPIDEKAIRVGSTHPFLFLRFRSLTSPPRTSVLTSSNSRSCGATAGRAGVLHPLRGAESGGGERSGPV